MLRTEEFNSLTMVAYNSDAGNYIFLFEIKPIISWDNRIFCNVKNHSTFSEEQR